MPGPGRWAAWAACIAVIVFAVAGCQAMEPATSNAAPAADTDKSSPERETSAIWGIASAAWFPTGDRIAPNGKEYRPLLSLDMQVNLWLSSRHGVYLFMDTEFWGQKPDAGITNATQGGLDFSKREFDLDCGAAWNYWGRWEARAFAYSFNNLNRGISVTRPVGFGDGVGLENRYYLTDNYDDLGTPTFDVARAAFVSLGFYPSKQMVDNTGQPFAPGPFARAYLTLDITEGVSYLYGDATLLGDQAFRPKLLQIDTGAAVRPPFLDHRWEFRLGTGVNFDFRAGDPEWLVYLAARYVF